MKYNINCIVSPGLAGASGRQAEIKLNMVIKGASHRGGSCGPSAGSL